MAAIVLSACNHLLNGAQVQALFSEKAFTIVIEETAQDIFSQFNEQFKEIKISCPECQKEIKQIAPREENGKRFPLTDGTFSMIKISPLAVKLHKRDDTQKKNENMIHFKRVELTNIINKERNSQDKEETYRRLSEIANDFKTLTDAFGSVLGRALYWLPLSWKVSVYINNMKKCLEKGLAHGDWVLYDQTGQTVGTLSLSQVEKEKFALEEPLASQKLYNVGVLFHSDFQRKGVVTELTNHLIDWLGRSKLEIDALWIATRPDNVGGNRIAEYCKFTFFKQMNVENKGLLPCISSSYILFNLYIKEIGSPLETL